LTRLINSSLSIGLIKAKLRARKKIHEYTLSLQQQFDNLECYICYILSFASSLFRSGNALFSC
ncbi:MAG: hypothetical protein WBZ36_09880, partial [Candidatus Nitrosopolaris sp.]